MNRIIQLASKDFRAFDWPVKLSALLVVCLAFGVYDFYFDTGAKLNGIIEQALKNPAAYQHHFGAVDLSRVMYGLVAATMLYIAGHAYFSYTLMLKKTAPDERRKFKAIVLSHALANAIDLIITFFIFSAFGGILYLFSGRYLSLDTAITAATENLGALFQSIPTLIELPYPLGFFAAIVLADLPQYIKHWLTHQSRFLWYVVHRIHHTAELMHPFGIGPAFALDFILRLPIFILTLAATKIFSEQPLFIETLVVTFVGVLIEKFNHSSAFYHFAYHNKFVRAISSFYGGGVYHYTHHSAVEGQEINNIGGMGFLFWDRLFGTFLPPPKDAPPVGLTHQPDIILNPFVLYFSGIHKIIYELKNNPPIYWLPILFGTVHFVPPNTRDTLILGYSKEIKKSTFQALASS
ncbi:MAG: hypothetical protein C4K60_17780 [Ideonella sp. MAG2]|nr:MAG: hypothetical protein C4K60_17780 [Ideonella sp. MAG2]